MIVHGLGRHTDRSERDSRIRRIARIDSGRIQTIGAGGGFAFRIRRFARLRLPASPVEVLLLAGSVDRLYRRAAEAADA